MPIVRQESLFSLEEFMEMKTTKRFEAMFSMIPVEMIVVQLVEKESRLG